MAKALKVVLWIFAVIGALAVVAVIAILLFVFHHVPSSNGTSGTASSTDAFLAETTDQVIAVSLVTAALTHHALNHHSYPPTLSGLVPEDLTQVPNDPGTNQPFVYTVTNNGTAYQLCDTTTSGPYCVSTTIDQNLAAFSH